MFTNEKLESAVSLYKTLYFTTDTTDAKTVLSYYLDNPLEFAGSLDSSLTERKLTALKNSLKDIEERYKARLYNEVLPTNATDKDGKPLAASIVKWFNEKKAGKILSDEAITFFIGRANDEMTLDIKVEFSKNQVRTTNFYADPIISDPRLRMSLEDKRWNEYDDTIKKEVAFYNQKFAGVAGFVPLDWRWVKAMVWTEVMAGPNERKGQWQTYPMQIGIVKGGVTDPGLPALKNGSENTDLIITPEFRAKLNQTTQMDGATNIKAGIAWLIRQACGDLVLVNENKIDDPQILTYTLDNKAFNGIEDKLKTTIKNIEINNPGINFNKSLPGQEIKYQKAHKERYISSWLDWKTAIKNYNSKKLGIGDDKYTPKFEKAYKIIISREK